MDNQKQSIRSLFISDSSNKCSTTISQESTLQAYGNGNGESPNEENDIV